ncbi:hypothetical protein [Scleromatobacter humisilvae]|uniref:Uncharacterized protein n=1 Tax=Scleromatobacter humisilvae TaxID=2897159 RepID=A0A9X1YQX2_9BURK|nr:hypothetical protein [Scleromatobacter humisilvae]MCK9689632.1 hypothetical protein [Scleromatobacter humisilvae]
MNRLIDAMKRAAGLPTENRAIPGTGALTLSGHYFEFNLCPQFDGIVVTVQHLRRRAPAHAVDQSSGQAEISVERGITNVTKPGSPWARFKALLGRLGML